MKTFHIFLTDTNYAPSTLEYEYCVILIVVYVVLCGIFIGKYEKTAAEIVQAQSDYCVENIQ